ncbi:hypothetical protein, conserved [Eimeria brunetti]|uniref:Uncharacterized protein n=1 Tax=Eimeria brunetti TaxID=51314 RepID=U6LIP6_9EIME|nr:hypothetical protein, conserved [Eimeria brunetti]
MKHKGPFFSFLLRMQTCCWLFVAVCLAQQQDGYSSAAQGNKGPHRGPPSPPVTATDPFPPDSMARLHAQWTAQREMTESQFGKNLVSKKQVYAIAAFVLFLVMARAMSLRKKEKPAEKAQGPTEELGEGLSGPEGEEPPFPEGTLPIGEGDEDMYGPEVEDPDALGEEEDDFVVERPIKRSRMGRNETMRKDRGPPDAPPFATQVQPGIGGEEGEGEFVQQPLLPPPTEPFQDPSLEQFPEPSSAENMGYMAPTDMVGVPPFGAPGLIPGMIADEDGELQELRVRRNVVSNLVDTAMRLAGELAGEAPMVTNTLKVNVEAAEKAERNYDMARSRGDPNLPAIRDDVVNIMRASLSGARDALINLVALAKAHGEQVSSYCSEALFFTNVERLRQPLEESLESKSIKVCAASLASVENGSITLQQENEDQLRILRETQFIDECEAQDFVQAYGAVAAMNFRVKTVQRLAALDSALMENMLAMHKEWLRWKLQTERIPLEMDANLVQGLHFSLSKSRPAFGGQPASGTTDLEMQSIKELFEQQSQDMNALDTARDVETVTAAYERAKTFNNKLKYLVQLQKEKLYSVLQKQPLNKEESAAASETMAKIAETAVIDSEEFVRFAQSVYSEVGDKSEDGLVSGGKALLQKLTTKIKSSAAEPGEDGASGDTSAAALVKKYFSEPWRQTESAKDQWSKAQEMHASAKKSKKYKLDKDGLGSSALEKRTNLRVDVATRKAEAALFLHRFRYLYILAREFEVLEETISSVLMFPFQPASDAFSEVLKLKAMFDSEKALLRDAQCSDAIPEYSDSMQQITWRMWSLLEAERLSQLKETVQRARAQLHNLAPE